MGTIASQITSLTIVYSTVYSDADQRKHQSSASLAFVWGIHRVPVKSPHKGPVTRKMFSFDDVIMCTHNKTKHNNTVCIFHGTFCGFTPWAHKMRFRDIKFLRIQRKCLILEYFVSKITLDDVIMGAMASQITNLTIVYSTVYSGSDQRKHQSSASLAFVRGIHRWPVNFPHQWPVTRKMCQFDDVFMRWWPRINDAGTSSDFYNKVCCRYSTLREFTTPQKLFGGLVICSETPTWLEKPMYLKFISRNNHSADPA